MTEFKRIGFASLHGYDIDTMKRYLLVYDSLKVTDVKGYLHEKRYGPISACDYDAADELEYLIDNRYIEDAKIENLGDMTETINVIDKRLRSQSNFVEFENLWNNDISLFDSIRYQFRELTLDLWRSGYFDKSRIKKKKREWREVEDL